MSDSELKRLAREARALGLILLSSRSEYDGVSRVTYELLDAARNTLLLADSDGSSPVTLSEVEECLQEIRKACERQRALHTS